MNEIDNVYSIILAGGSGTRLWPVSRELFPKQFTKLVGSNSLISSTILRTCNIVDKNNIFIVLGENHKLEVATELENHNLESNVKLVVEPCGRNTAPAILLGLLEINKVNKDAVVVVFPADHVIEDGEVFHEHVKRAVDLAKLGHMVTFGIKPNKPETGYGYIEAGNEIEFGSNKINQFVEKPDYETAKEYISSGNYYWNSGIFAFKVSEILREFDRVAEDISKPLLELFNNNNINKDSYEKLPNISIDYAIMEKTHKGAVLPSTFKWSDIGSWESLYEYSTKNNDNNVLHGNVIAKDTHNSLIKSDKRLIAVNGLDDVAVVETDDAVFISHINKTQNVKSIVEELRNNDRNEAKCHNTIYKPWGYYSDIDAGDGFRVKRIGVYPGKRLSLQKHEHRSENWTIIKGRATVTNGDDVFDLDPNQSTFIPSGIVHRLENKDENLLELIEIQFGNYLEEDDITRIEDDFGRV